MNESIEPLILTRPQSGAYEEDTLWDPAEHEYVVLKKGQLLQDGPERSTESASASRLGGSPSGSFYVIGTCDPANQVGDVRDWALIRPCSTISAQIADQMPRNSMADWIVGIGSERIAISYLANVRALHSDVHTLDAERIQNETEPLYVPSDFEQEVLAKSLIRSGRFLD